MARPAALAGALALLLAAACSRASASLDDEGPASGSTAHAAATTTERPTTTLPPTTTTAAPTTTTAAPAPVPAGHAALDGHLTPVATVGDVGLVFPSSRVERVGFHQSSVLGAQELTPFASTIPSATLNTRARGTGDRTAADIVVEPGSIVTAPVSGTVVTAGAYRLYCAYDDETVVIAPDLHPAWHVTLLHLTGVTVTAGQRVEAGVTQIAAHAHQLPFPSQIDKLSKAKPPWPHVHLEVDDPAVADTPSKGDSC